MKVKIIRTDYSDQKKGELGEVVEKKFVGTKEEVWRVKTIKEVLRWHRAPHTKFQPGLEVIHDTTETKRS